jgi:hypothetical protein
MTSHVRHKFSATCATPDLAVVGCLLALAEFVQRTGDDNALFAPPYEKDWLTAGEKITLTFARALDRDLFKNEVRRLLPANLVRFEAESDSERASP